MGKLNYVNLEDISDQYYATDHQKLPIIGDIYLAGTSLKDLVTGLYKEKYYVLLEITSDGYLVAPYETLCKVSQEEVKDASYATILHRGCKFSNQEAFHDYIDCTVRGIYEKHIMVGMRRTTTNWVEKDTDDPDVNFITRDYLSDDQYTKE